MSSTSWYHDNKQILLKDKNFSLHDNNLVINNISKYHIGAYQCEMYSVHEKRYYQSVNYVIENYYREIESKIWQFLAKFNCEGFYLFLLKQLFQCLTKPNVNLNIFFCYKLNLGLKYILMKSPRHPFV